MHVEVVTAAVTVVVLRILAERRSVRFCRDLISPLTRCCRITRTLAFQ